MPRPSDPRIRFYFDYVSPNAYLAWTQLPALAERHGVAIEPVAVLFAGLLEAFGQLGPAELPEKMRWMERSNLRKAARLGVALNPPAYHPFNPLLALRVSSLALPVDERRALVDALFVAVWVEGLHVAEPDVVRDVAERAGLDGGELIAQAQLAPCKDRLRRQTEDAIARGVFGVPMVEARDELFWGFDDFAQLDAVLGGQDPLTPEILARWAVPARASAVRKRSPGDAPPKPR